MNDRKDISDPERERMDKEERAWMDAMNKKTQDILSRNPVEEKKKWMDWAEEFKK